jgi:hypothetical protein
MILRIIGEALSVIALCLALVAIGGTTIAFGRLRTMKRRWMPTPNHWPKDMHFTGITLDNQKFLYCPVGNIVSWSGGDYDHKWCHYEGKYFTELSQ